LKWQLYLLLEGDENNAILLEEDVLPLPTAGVLTELDTTKFPNGRHRLRLRVVRRDGNYDEYFRTMTIDNQAISVVNGIVKPVEGETIFGIVTIKGFADDPNFDSWDIDLLVEGDEKRPVQLKRDSIPNRTGDTFTRLDTTTLSNGMHRLRLRVVTKDGNYKEYFRTFTVNQNVTAVPTQAPRETRTPRPPTSVALKPQNQIASPSEGETVSGLVPITGFADDENFSAWQLDLLFKGDAQRVNLLEMSKKRMSGEPFTTLDTRSLPNGRHVLRLRIIRLDESFDEILSTINVANPEKVAAPTPRGCDEPLQFATFGHVFVSRLFNRVVPLINGLCVLI
jgi:hypothetical protein